MARACQCHPLEDVLCFLTGSSALSSEGVYAVIRRVSWSQLGLSVYPKTYAGNT